MTKETISVAQAYAMAQVCLDLHEALGCKWGDNPYLTISQLKAQPAQEPVCPECKAEVLYECVACSSNNYPPQRTWVGLTKEDMPGGENPMFDHEYFIAGMVFAANILKEKNNGA